MPGPWEKYQEQPPAQAQGPWTKYQQPPADFSDVTARIDSTERRITPSANNSDFAGMISGRPREKGNKVTRALGQAGARQVVQGAYGLYGALGGDALDHYVLTPIDHLLGIEGTKFQIGTGGRGYRQAASDFADSLGMAKPQTPAQRVISDVGEGLTGTALTLGMGGFLSNLGRAGATPGANSAASTLGDFLTKQPVLQTVSSATGAGAAGTARESGASQGAQIIAGLAGGLAPGITSATAGATTRGLLRGPSGAVVQSNLDRFRVAGSTPTVGQASEKALPRGLEALLGKAPGSSGAMGAKLAQQNEEIGRSIDSLAGNLAFRSDPTKAGRAITQGITGPGGFMDDFKGRSTRLYNELDQYLPGNARIQASNAARYLSQQTASIPGASATSALLANQKLSAIREALESDLAAGNGAIPYEALKRVRSQIGDLISDSGLMPDIPVRQLRGLYGELSKDMEAAARATGNQKAIQAFNRANSHFRAGMNRLDMIESVVGRQGGSEAVFSAAISGTREGATKLRAVMQSLPPDSQKMVSATMLRRLGRAVNSQQDDLGEQFSAETFLTNWNKLSPEAQSVLFDRYSPNFRKDLGKIAKVANNLRTGDRTMPNASGSAPAGAKLYTAGALALAVLTKQWAYAGGIVAGMTSAWGGAKLMTNPAFVGWLARATEAPIGSLPPMIGQLHRLAEQNQDWDMEAFARELEAKAAGGR